MRIGIGVVIAIILIFYWYKKDHPDVPVVKTGYSYSISSTQAA